MEIEKLIEEFNEKLLQAGHNLVVKSIRFDHVEDPTLEKALPPRCKYRCVEWEAIDGVKKCMVRERVCS